MMCVMTRTIAIAITVVEVFTLRNPRKSVLPIQHYGRSADESLLDPIELITPDSEVFPRAERTMFAPQYTEVSGAKSTNKFWGNWIVNEGWQYSYHLPLYTMPYTIRWKERGSSKAGELAISHATPEYIKDVQNALSPPTDNYVQVSSVFKEEITIGMTGDFLSEYHTIVKEDLFGVHVEVRGPLMSGRKITYPIFVGMAYVSAKYDGGCTPRLTGSGITVDKVRDGVWKYTNDNSSEFRIYALDTNGNPVGSDYDLTKDEGSKEIVMNKPLDGWIRIAQVIHPSDVTALDAHAGAIVLGAKLEVFEGVAEYHWEVMNNAELLHFGFPHHVKQLLRARVDSSMAQSRAPTKGMMTPINGNIWGISTNLDRVNTIGFLPPGEPNAAHVDLIKTELAISIADYAANWQRKAILWEYYWTGKQLQKISTLCLMAEKFMGVDHSLTRTCVGVLEQAFTCMYDPAAGGRDCANAPSSYYDKDWHGIASKFGFNEWGGAGQQDFGNACYNDHHYHFGYFVVAASALVKLKPELKRNVPFVHWVNILIRDASNPSRDDKWFPQFRAFDWFDMHSWSRGLAPSPDGKDQESTSEELNLMYGMILWAREFGNVKLEKLAATMLSFDVTSINEYFLMKRDNQNYDPDFALNHVTGIFFANSIKYDTWFGRYYEYIHGVQMLPLSPALLLTRTPEFCEEEWTDVLSKLPNHLNNPWTSLLLTGSLAIARPEEALQTLLQMSDEFMDDGLTKAWAIYWISVRLPKSWSPSLPAASPN